MYLLRVCVILLCPPFQALQQGKGFSGILYFARSSYRVSISAAIYGARNHPIDTQNFGVERICSELFANSKATPVRKIQPSKPVIGFCTAIIFEVLGLVTVDSDTVKRILPYVNSGLQLGAKGLNQKAAALMIVSLLAQKAALASNVVKNLLHSVAGVAKADAKGGDLRWLRMSVMTMITVVQLQSVESIPKKTVDIINEIRDISEILSGLTKDFNIDKFLAVLLESLTEHSASDDLCHHTLLSIVETVPMNSHVNHIVSRLVAAHLKISQGKSESGCQDKKILASICDKYPNESREAFYSFLKGPTIQSKKAKSNYDVLCKIFDDHVDA